MAEDPQVTARDLACAVFARAALFPWKVDWSGKHHSIHPAVQALDLVRKDVIELKNGTISALFPRGVVVVPSSSEVELQWNGQPIIKESSVEIIPNILTVKCIECLDGNNTTKSFTRITKEEGKNAQLCHEIVLCTNRLLKSDYSKSKDPTLLEQRKDLPPQSLAAVEEALAHEIIKFREKFRLKDNNDPSSNECAFFAATEIEAARRAECFYEKKGSEVRKGSCLKPPGFSWLPETLQRNLQSRCVKAVATQTTCREFGAVEGKKCVTRAMEKISKNNRQ